MQSNTAKNIFTKKFEFTVSNIDARQNVSLMHILEMLQDVATINAEMLGFGWDALKKENKVWVLSKIRVELARQIVQDDTVFLTTFPREPSRFFAEREFFATDAAGNRLLCATSKWCLLDIATRQMVNPHQIDFLYSGPYKTEQSGANRNFDKVVLNADFYKNYEKIVRFSDLDLNFHVNNTKYISYAIDAASENLLKRDISAFEVCYHSEAKANDIIEIYTNETADRLLTVGVKDGKTCFTAKIEY